MAAQTPSITPSPVSVSGINRGFGTLLFNTKKNSKKNSKPKQPKDEVFSNNSPTITEVGKINRPPNLKVFSNNSPIITKVGLINRRPKFLQQLNRSEEKIIENPQLRFKLPSDKKNLYKKHQDRVDKFFFSLKTKLLYQRDNKIKIIKKCPNLKKKGHGGFGIVGIDPEDGQFKKIMPNMLKKYMSTTNEKVFDWMFNRYTKFCQHMVKFTKASQKLFPKNIINYGIKECNYCQQSENSSQYMNNYSLVLTLEQRGKGDFSELIQNKTLNVDDINSIMAQLFYIALVLNENSLYHNDFKPTNIVIEKTNEPITYSGFFYKNKEFKLKVNAGEYIPVVIDYDFASFKHFHDLGDIVPVQRNDLMGNQREGDFSYMSFKIDEMNHRFKKNKLKGLSNWLKAPTLMQYIKSNMDIVPYLEKIGKKGEVIGIDISVEGGKKKKTKKTKKVRKHQGITQTGGNAGRLRKGYKYSGKKLKSGLPQIIKCKSKRC